MTEAQLPGVFGHLQPVLEHYGYLAVGGFVLLEDFGVPLPGETILIAAAIFAGSGHMNIAVVVVVAVIAAIIGDNIGFVIGHFGGRPLVHRYGRYIFLTPERLDQAEDYFNRHGGKIVTIARFIRGAAPAQRHPVRHHRHALGQVPGVQRPGRRLMGGHLGRAGIPGR